MRRLIGMRSRSKRNLVEGWPIGATKNKGTLGGMVCALWIVLGAATMSPAMGGPSHGELRAYPRCLVEMPGEEGARAIVVDKERGRLSVFEHRGRGLIKVLEVRCSTGENSGQKIRSWDRRTPEGVFWVIKHISGEDLPRRYGEGALVLDYPNFFDRLHGRGGGGIWIHGSSDPRRIEDPNSSGGCVVVTNDAFRRIYSLVGERETPVVILPRVPMLSMRSWAVQRRRFSSLLKDWMELWASNDYPTGALELYSRAFASDALGVEQFFRHRSKVVSTLTVGDIDLRGVWVMRSGPIAVSRFSMCLDGSTGPGCLKMSLYWAMEAGQWRIIGEEVLPESGGPGQRSSSQARR